MTMRPMPHEELRRRWVFRMTPTRYAFLALASVGGVVAVYRLFFGLGPTTNLNDRWPWGLWVWWDVMTGVALAGGGYSTALLVNFLGRENWRSVERGALLTSLLGYIMVCTGLFLDLGRWFNVSGVPFFWRENPHSVMFELVWCVSGYTFVQLVEFGHVFVERVRAPRLSRVLSKIYVPVLIVGVMLPMLHQSALGSIYLLARGRLDPLWWSMLLPLFFLTSSFFVGPAMVAVENALAGRAHGRRPPLRIISEMTRLAGGIMLAYFAVKVGDVVWRGAYRELANGSVASDLFLVEMVAGVLIPAVMFLRPRTSRSAAGLLTAASLAVAGVALNRANVVFTGMMASAGGATYVPSWTELALTFGIIAAGLLAYLFVAENFPVYRRDDVSAVEARRSEEQARKEAEAA